MEDSDTISVERKSEHQALICYAEPLPESLVKCVMIEREEEVVVIKIPKPTHTGQIIRTSLIFALALSLTLPLLRATIFYLNGLGCLAFGPFAFFAALWSISSFRALIFTLREGTLPAVIRVSSTSLHVRVPGNFDWADYAWPRNNIENVFIHPVRIGCSARLVIAVSIDSEVLGTRTYRDWIKIPWRRKGFASGYDSLNEVEEHIRHVLGFPPF